MNIRKILFLFTSVLFLVGIVGCGGKADSTDEETINFEINKLSADTVYSLFGGKNGPKCEVEYSLNFAEGNDVEYINNFITKKIFPQSDSSDLETAVHNEMLEIVEDYKATLKGVTKKSISDGSFAAASAEYKRSVSTSYEILKNEILVYNLSFSEKAYGESTGVENEFTFNISIKDKREVTLDDIFVHGYKARLVDKIIGVMAENYKVKGIDGLRQKGLFTDGMPYAPDNFVIAKDEIIFIYNPFEIAGRRYGIIKVNIPAEQLKDIMKKERYAFFDIK